MKLNLFSQGENTPQPFPPNPRTTPIPHKLLYALGISFAFLLSGCASSTIQKVAEPRPIDVVGSSYNAAQKAQDVTNYNALIQAGNLAGARVVRDIIVQSVRKEIGVVYQEFESGLFAKKAAFEVETDVFELLLSTAVTLTGAPQARTNLSALLTGTKGTRLSVDKNVFGEKTYGALVSQMRASRSKANANIFEKLARLDVIGYPLAEAENDLIQLFNAGTIHDALVQLTTQAGAAAEAQARIEDQNARIKLSPATQQEVDQITSIRSKFNDLYKKQDISSAKIILKKLVPTVKDDIPAADIWKKLDTEIRKAADPNQLPTLINAFSIN